MSELTMPADAWETLIPQANFRWAWRAVPDHQGDRVKVLQQAFLRHEVGTVAWIDVPTVDETGASQ